MTKIKPGILCAFFSFSIITKAAPPEIILIRTNADSIGLYDKFEISLNVKAEGKQRNINGFYNYASGTVWKLRYSPNEAGKWNYTIQVTDKNGKK